jgi:hypothetical protein
VNPWRLQSWTGHKRIREIVVAGSRVSSTYGAGAATRRAQLGWLQLARGELHRKPARARPALDFVDSGWRGSDCTRDLLDLSLFAHPGDASSGYLRDA